jgi:hypothetical protein
MRAGGLDCSSFQSQIEFPQSWTTLQFALRVHIEPTSVLSEVIVQREGKVPVSPVNRLTIPCINHGADVFGTFPCPGHNPGSDRPEGR